MTGATRTVGGALARPELAPLVDELARRFGEGGVPSTIGLARLPRSSYRALADLLGLDRLPRPSGRIRTQHLADALGMTSLDALRGVVEGLRGPLPDRRAERLASRLDRDELWTWLAREAATLALGGDGAGLATWVEAQRARGTRGGVAVHRRRLERALAVVRALPADGVPLAAFATDHAGDPHALDRGRSLTAIVLDAVATALALPAPVAAEDARLLWEAVGVVPDPLSSTVLTLGLPGDGDTPLGCWLSAAAAASHPVVLTLADLRRWPPPPLPPAATAFVVENPALVAEAAATGWTGAVLVCSSGRPTVAVVELLRRLGAGGAALNQHADFDPTGLAITAWLAERAGTTPWRMTSDEYLRAVGRRRDRRPLTGSVPQTPWDPRLEEVLREEGVVVYEEDVRADLLQAMRRGRRRPDAARGAASTTSAP